MSESYEWIECGSCGELYPVGGSRLKNPVESSPESAEHHDPNCPVRTTLEERGQTAERPVHAGGEL